MASLREALDQARVALAGASQLGDLQARKNHARALMESFRVIGLASDVARAPEVESFVQATAPLLRSADGGLAMWLGDVDNPTFEDEEGYQIWLWDRSAIEYARDLYRGTSAEAYVRDLDTEEIDELIHFKARYFGRKCRPAGTPPHHWWWDL